MACPETSSTCPVLWEHVATKKAVGEGLRPIVPPGNGHPLKLWVTGILGRLYSSFVEDELDGDTNGGKKTREEIIVAASERSSSQHWTSKNSGLGHLHSPSDSLHPGHKRPAGLWFENFYNPEDVPTPSENCLKYTHISLHLTGLLYEWQYCTWQRSHMLLILKEALGFFGESLEGLPFCFLP